MATILHLETATTNCSVSIAKAGRLVALREDDSPNYSHSEQLHVFIMELLEETSIAMDTLDAVAVSKGPGSYTGLRIGVSAAKGLCFSLDIPLIAIPTLESMAQRQQEKGYDFIVPMLDARRMEVYSAVYDQKGMQRRETRAEVITRNSFQEFTDKGRVLLVGSGAEKCKALLSGPAFGFNTIVVPSAKDMCRSSALKFERKDFEDVAYFEPYYLKDFMFPTKK